MHTRMLLFLTSLLLLACVGDKLVIIGHSSYAVGSVDNYSPAAKVRSQIMFRYVVHNQLYHGQYEDADNGWHVPVDAHIKTYDKFMVQYDSITPAVARMLFNYPVHDTTDYIKYVEQFKVTPPGY